MVSLSVRKMRIAALITVASCVAIVVTGGQLASGVFDVRQACRDAVTFELRVAYGLRSTTGFSVTHETVRNVPGNSQEVHGVGKYQANGKTQTIKFECIVSNTDGRVKELAVHP